MNYGAKLPRGKLSCSAVEVREHPADVSLWLRGVRIILDSCVPFGSCLSPAYYNAA